MALSWPQKCMCGVPQESNHEACDGSWYCVSPIPSSFVVKPNTEATAQCVNSMLLTLIEELDHINRLRAICRCPELRDIATTFVQSLPNPSSNVRVILSLPVPLAEAYISLAVRLQRPDRFLAHIQGSILYPVQLLVTRCGEL